MALENELALKKTQPRQTNWNVQKRCHHTRAAPSATGGQSAGDPALRRRRCPTTWPAPWSAPQMMNVQLAPCHRPPSTIVIMMLRAP